MSESAFVGMCLTLGTSQQLAIRREIADIQEMVHRKLMKTNDFMVTYMLSGSRREGFRLKGSDVDTMYWPEDHRVIMDMSQIEYYNTANITLILSESSECPPGFTLLHTIKKENK